jgi:hypothetical protein
VIAAVFIYGLPDHRIGVWLEGTQSIAVLTSPKVKSNSYEWISLAPVTTTEPSSYQRFFKEDDTITTFKLKAEKTVAVGKSQQPIFVHVEKKFNTFYLAARHATSGSDAALTGSWAMLKKAT